jgi:hypothetical protein
MSRLIHCTSTSGSNGQTIVGLPDKIQGVDARDDRLRQPVFLEIPEDKNANPSGPREVELAIFFPWTGTSRSGSLFCGRKWRKGWLVDRPPSAEYHVARGFQ